LLLKGTHGTTISSAKNILQHQSFLKTAAENGYTGSDESCIHIENVEEIKS